MIISVVSPLGRRVGNSVTSLLLAHALADTKRHTFVTHTSAKSKAYEGYLGLSAFEDKTSTPSQLVKLMREGAIQSKEIGDYCSTVYDFLDVFTTTNTNFTEDDKEQLVDFLVSSEKHYDYMVFDVEDMDSDTSRLALRHSDIIILNVTDNVVDLKTISDMQQELANLCSGKKVVLSVSNYDAKVVKLKDIPKHTGLNTNCQPIRKNSWLKWACNNGKLTYVFSQGRSKDADVLEVYKDSVALASAVNKAKIAISKGKKGVFKK